MATPTSLSLEQLIALNDEIIALSRAGVPLERGLGALGRDMPGRLGSAARELAERLDRGESLPAALAAEGASFPPVYRAVLEAGLQSGRLPAALEGMATSARRLSELHRVVTPALLYPLLVMLLAAGLFVFLTVELVPRYLQAMDDLSLPRFAPLEWLDLVGQSAWSWGPPVMVGVIVLAISWWYLTSRSMMLMPGWSGRGLGWLPWVRALLRQSRAALISNLLALLVENDVPLPHALRVAGATTGDSRIETSCEQLALCVERGESLDSRALAQFGVSALASWMITQGHQQSTLALALRKTSEDAHRSALRQAQTIRAFVPVVLLIALGGSVTLIYAVSYLLPLVWMMNRLASFT